jgi:hypothetical protein
MTEPPNRNPGRMSARPHRSEVARGRPGCTRSPKSASPDPAGVEAGSEPRRVADASTRFRSWPRPPDRSLSGVGFTVEIVQDLDSTT